MKIAAVDAKAPFDEYVAGTGVLFPLLSSPIWLAGLEIPNRISMAAMSSVLASEEGHVTPEIIAYYKARAEGGVGLVTVEFTGVNRDYGRAELHQLMLDDDQFLEGHRELARVIKTTGARAAIQLHLPGQHADRRTVDALPAGPSDEFSRRDGITQLSRALAAAEIDELVESFRLGARRAIEAGYEAIELHGAHGYLLMAFLSPLKNRRDDAWGGDFERRLRFPTAVIRAIKAELGSNRPLIYRLSSTDFLPGGLDLEQTLLIVPALIAAGVDAINVSSGSIDGTLDLTVDPMSMPEAWRFEHSATIRKIATVPVMSVGPIRWPALAEKGIADGAIDMLALGRPLLADPDWVKKALSNRVGDIRPCTNCNWCFDRVLKHHSISCAENPRAGRETQSMPLVGGEGKLAIVIGAGPGGMAAALDLAEAGFTTQLYEARGELGGGLIASASPPHKDKLFWYLDHLKGRLANSSVEILLNTPIDPGLLVDLTPSLVILATGARPLSAGFDGAGQPNVSSAYTMLMSDSQMPEPTTKPVLVYGGGETGCETAEYLAARGHEIVLVTRSPAKQLARAAENMYRKHLLARLKANPKISILENTTMKSIMGEVAVLQGPEGRNEVSVSHVIVAQGRQTGSELEQTLKAKSIPYALVGDVETVGRIGDAVHAARRAVVELASQLSS